MQKLHLAILINAPKEKVWHTMLDRATYREWTKAFSEGSDFEGSWEQGAKIVFGDGTGNGMLSRIAESRPFDFVSIEHMGIIKDGVEDTTSEEAMKWSPAFENYTFIDEAGATKLVIDLDIEEEYKEMFEEMWNDGLQCLKVMAEAE